MPAPTTDVPASLGGLPWPEPGAAGPDAPLTREWIVTNGLGGYASGTVAGVPTRRYHAALVAALPAPLGRFVMLNHLDETLHLPDGRAVPLVGFERSGGGPSWPVAGPLRTFRLEGGLPCWRFEIDGFVVEKRLLLVHRQNTAHVAYRLADGPGPLRLELRPAIHPRPHDAPVSAPVAEPYACREIDGRRIEVAIGGAAPPLRLAVAGPGAAFASRPGWEEQIVYRLEAQRGYESVGSLWSPGAFRVTLDGEGAALVASAERWEAVDAISTGDARRAELERREILLERAEPAARGGPAGVLCLAADAFVIEPAGRVADEARALAEGGEARTVIAGYHWFTDWGRDTMISLEGLALVTGRGSEAGEILRTFARHARDGLIPNYFPDGQNEGVYHTADATLWFFHAAARYVQATGDRRTLRDLLPTFRSIVEHHQRGTRFGIGVDPADGLLRQGAEGYQLTWMDAKVGDWVVTPRRGKAVEINALWYNALRLLEGWLRDEGAVAEADPLAGAADRAFAAFNRRFWSERDGYLLDVVDGPEGDDPACRPNQILAISLDHPVLDPSRWEAVLGVVRNRLLTPVGLRSLAPGHPDYKPKYFGDLLARDAAYHQGTVWAWLSGPYIDAYLRVHPDDRDGARAALEGFVPHLGEAGLGTISEVFDAEPPYTARGCIAQAWSVAEVLRCWVKAAS